MKDKQSIDNNFWEGERERERETNGMTTQAAPTAVVRVKVWSVSLLGTSRHLQTFRFTKNTNFQETTVHNRLELFVVIAN